MALVGSQSLVDSCSNTAQICFFYIAQIIFYVHHRDEVWGPDEQRESKLVFIGKNLDEDALRSGFAKCITSPELEEEKKKQLRFAVGDSVECTLSLCSGSESWGPAGEELALAKGKIVALLHREEFMPDGKNAPYQVKLDNGDIIYALRDVDDVVRKA
jgi:hypothetical protein